MNWIVSLFLPLLLHMVTSELIAVIFGGRLDSSMCTTITAVIVIPAAAWMYWKDQQDSREERLDSRKDRKDSREDRQHIGRRGRNRLFRNNDGRNRRVGACVLFGVFCFAAGGILNLVWSGVLNLMKVQEFFSNQAQERLLAGQILVQIVGLGILVPVAEELVFRALIYTRMKRVLTVKQAVFFSALLFAVYHGNPIQMLFAFPMAVALAVVFEYGKLSVFPVLFHMGANLTTVLLNFFG